MKIIYVKAAVLIVLTLFLSMPMIHLPTTVNADPGIINVPGLYGPTISAAITAAGSGDTIIVAAGIYPETLEISKSLNITGVGAVKVQGGIMFATHYGNRQVTIYVHDASNVVLNGLDVEGIGLGVPGGTKSYAILYEAASGIVIGCTVSPNTIGDLNAVGIAAWDGSNLAVKDCIVKNFGRVGIYSNAATMDIERNSIIGQPYNGSGDVNYGIEIEDYTGPSTADIIDNEIYNCGNSNPSPLWSSSAILVDIWRYYNLGSLVPSTVHIVGNNIHDNFEAIEIVGNAGGIVSNQYAHYNSIHDNLWGVWTDTDENVQSTYFDAQYNWWGNPAGPTGNDCDPAYVIYTNYLTGPYAERLYIDSPSVNKVPSDVGTTFAVYVKLENFVNLMGFDIKLTWGSSLITETSVDHNTYLDALWGAGKWSIVAEFSGAGYYELVATSTSTAASNIETSTLFKMTFSVDKSCNFPLSTTIQFDMVKLSDNGIPTPNPIVPATVTGGAYTMSSITPNLEFNVLKQNKKTLVYEPATLPGHFEAGNYFEVQVYVTDISVNSPLQDYDVRISFDHTLARFVDVDVWGVLGAGAVDYTAGSDVVHVSCTNFAGWYGDSGLLFTLTFHVEFAATANHIWKNINANYMTFQISITNATLSFALGSIGMSGITTPSALTFEVDFIRGDVDCNGVVNIADISSAAYYYGHPVADKPEYDLNNDHVINIYDMVTIATNYGYGMDP